MFLEKNDMTTKPKLTHYLKNDLRVDSLIQIITGLDNSIITLKNRLEEVDWYDGDWLDSDSEPIYGLAFISFQNYINGSINDLYDSLTNKTKFCKIEPISRNYTCSSVELIIGLANYIKHKDEGTLHKGTREILDSFNLNYNEDKAEFVSESPIFGGLSILSVNWNLFEILEIVIYWRKKLFEEFEKNDI